MPETAVPGNSQEAAQDREKEIVKSIMKADSDDSDDSSASGDSPAEDVKDHPSLVKPRDFDSYTYNVPHVELKSSVMVGKKLRYIFDEALADLGFRNIRSIAFWMSLLVLVMAMWSRSYMHTFGSWILLKLASIAVSRFDPMMYVPYLRGYGRYGFALEYSTRNVGVLLGVILFGNLFNTLVFGLLILMSWGFQRFVRRAPRMVYKFVASYGIAIIFDFFLIGVVDLICAVCKL